MHGARARSSHADPHPTQSIPVARAQSVASSTVIMLGRLQLELCQTYGAENARKVLQAIMGTME